MAKSFLLSKPKCKQGFKIMVAGTTSFLIVSKKNNEASIKDIIMLNTMN